MAYKVPLFLVTICLLLCVVQSNKKGSCSGGFDVYFVLDKSQSVGSFNFQNRTVQFIEGILNRLVSPKLRLSLVTFSENAEIILPLTKDRRLIANGMKKLQQVVPGGRTYMEFGLDKVLNQIKSKGSHTVSVVIILTDGELSERNSFKKADELRDLAATVVAVGVENYKLDQLEKLANKPKENHVFRAKDYNALQSITETVRCLKLIPYPMNVRVNIINKACIEVTDVEPEKVCIGASYDVTVKGKGFTKTFDKSKIICNFRLNDTKDYVWDELSDSIQPVQELNLENSTEEALLTSP